MRVQITLNGALQRDVRNEMFVLELEIGERTGVMCVEPGGDVSSFVAMAIDGYDRIDHDFKADRTKELLRQRIHLVVFVSLSLAVDQH